MVRVLDRFGMALALILVSCAPQSNNGDAHVQIVFGSASKFGTMTTGLALDPNLCYGFHVTGPGLMRLEEPGSSCTQGANGLGLVFGLYNKGDTAELSIPIGSSRRFDMIGIPKTSLPGASCSGIFAAEVIDASAGKVALKLNGITIADNVNRYFATGTKDIVAGDNVVTLNPVTSDSAGIEYGCHDGDSGNGGLLINNGAAYSQSEFLNLSLYYPQTATDYCVSEGPDCSSCTAGDWNPVSSSVSYTTSAGDDHLVGLRIKFRLADSTETSCAYGDSINVDTVDPSSVTISSPAQGLQVTTDSLTISGTCSENNGRVEFVNVTDSTVLGRANCSSGAYSMVADLGSLANNTYTVSQLKVRLTDKSGRFFENGLALEKANPNASLGLLENLGGPDFGFLDFGKIPLNTDSYAHTFSIVNAGTPTATSVSVELSAPFAFAGGSYPGTGGTCGTSLAGATSCTIRVYARSSVAGVFTRNLVLKYFNGVSQIAKNFGVQADFGTTSATKLVAVFPGQTFKNGSPTQPVDPPNVPYFNMYQGRSYPVRLIALDSRNYQVTSYTGVVSIESGEHDLFTPSSASMVAGEKTVTMSVSENGSSHHMVYFHSDNLFSDPGVDVPVDPYCSSPPNGTSLGFHDGTGTSTNPYVVCTLGEFANISTGAASAGKYYTLKTDVNFSAYAPVLAANCTDAGFQGVFDGASHWITNFDLNLSTEVCGGLFGRISANGVVRNLIIDASNYYGGTGAGRKAGMVAGLMSGGTIDHVSVRWNGGTSNSDTLGGLVGQMDAGLITSSNVLIGGSFIAPSSVGGLVGVMTGGSIEKSFVNGLGGGFLGGIGNTGLVGGLVGYMTGGTISRSRTGKSWPLPDNTLHLNEGALQGGLVGQMSGASAIVEDSSALIWGANSTGGHIGGLIGEMDNGTLRRSFYNGGDGTASGGLAPMGGMAGGVIAVYSTGILEKSYYNGSRYLSNTIDDTGPNTVFGGGCSGTYCSEAGVLADSQMKQSANFPGWDFSLAGGKWMMLPGISYPVLQWDSVSHFDASSSFYPLSEDGLGVTINSYSAPGSNLSLLRKQTGKWYWEVLLKHSSADDAFGILPDGSAPTALMDSSDGAYGLQSGATTGSILNSTPPAGVSIHTDAAKPQSGDILGFLLDLDVGTLRIFRKASSSTAVMEIKRAGSTGAAITNIPVGGAYYYRAAHGSIASPMEMSDLRFNFGQQPFQLTTTNAGLTGTPVNLGTTGAKPYNYIQ